MTLYTITTTLLIKHLINIALSSTMLLNTRLLSRGIAQLRRIDNYLR